MVALLKWAALLAVAAAMYVGINRGLDRFTSDLTLAFTGARQ